MSLLLIIGLGILLYYLFRRDKKPANPVSSVDDQLSARNFEWAQFIAGYRQKVKTKAEKALVEKMLADIAAKGLPIPLETQEVVVQPGAAEGSDLVGNLAPGPQAWTMPDETLKTPAPSLTSQHAATASTSAKPRQQVEIDNISLLLYFGAFLFVASVGLFIAFGGANGAVRTLAVTVVMLTMYFTGIWLYRTRPKLQQAGIAFSGIGMTIAPLTGVAAYNYLFDQQHAPFIWFLTSVLCLAMYLHAMIVFKKPLISYILIFTFLSLFESSVSIIHAPIYYFGWMMAIVGLGLIIASRAKGFWPELQASSQASAQIFLPLTVLISLVMVPSQGAGQLGVSLLLAAIFYCLETLNSAGDAKQLNAMVAQITAVTGALSLTYAVSPSLKAVAISLLCLNMVQLGALWLLPRVDRLWQNAASLLLFFGVVSMLIGLVNPVVLTSACTVMVVIGLAVWRLQDRPEAYSLAILAWMALPFAIGQYWLTVHLNPNQQAVSLLISLSIELAGYAWWRHKQSREWVMAAQWLYVVSSIAVLVTALFADPWVLFAITATITASMFLLADFDDDGDWTVVGGLLIAAPLIRAWDTPALQVATTLTGLVVNIFFALRYRKELNRWFSTLFWLLVPVAFGAAKLGGQWQVATYAWSYVVVAIGLIVSRVIARGGMLVSAKVPLASYARTASLSYVAGYWVAMTIAALTALVSTPARIHASLIFVCLGLLIYILAHVIEKQAELFALLPIIAQIVLWSALRPWEHVGMLNVTVFLGSMLAVGSYVIGITTGMPSKQKRAEMLMLQYGALIAAAIACFAGLSSSTLVIAVPFGLLVFGCLLSYHVRTEDQSIRELAAGVVVAALLWFMWYFGVRNVQAYTHAVAATFGAFAYWRWTKGDSQNTDNYLLCMLVTATVPLGLQALNGSSGGLYGWWLLLEQIGFMLLGMAIGKRLVVRWGLYVALGAVLYQLRNLGWAALTVLAMFIIGLAIYRLQKHDKTGTL